MVMGDIPTVVSFDMRAPDFGTPTPKLYAAALDMAGFVDEIGVNRINLMEHHASEDGYLPTPFVMGGGVAARTKNCRITLGAVILPLHDPVGIAEQIAVLDQMSNGRLEVILGAGYVAAEFALFGRSLKDRGVRLDQGLDIILRALHGERFEADGRQIYVRPLPVQAPEAIIMVGGGVEASARRAGRLGLGFVPLRPDLFPIYDAECRRYGHEPGRKSGAAKVSNIFLTHDPEKAWAQLMPHVKHVVSAYAKWAEGEPNSNSPFRGMLANDEALRRSGMFTVWTPEELLAKAPGVVGAYGSLTFMPLVGGLAPEIGWGSLELLKTVMPRLRTLQREAA
jgi:alkanesulfonate monooxygenase SsuD/methylene tetrahydromethanopterin reductase-like flavin-dependent oxidoreductase (luciferase family)